MATRKASFKLSGGKLPSNFSTVIAVEIDFTGLTTDNLIDMCMPSLKIDLQRWMRERPVEFVENLAKQGYKCHATKCGSAVRSPEEMVADLCRTLGINPDLAELIVKDPKKVEDMIAKLGK